MWNKWDTFVLLVIVWYVAWRVSTSSYDWWVTAVAFTAGWLLVDLLRAFLRNRKGRTNG